MTDPATTPTPAVAPCGRTPTQLINAAGSLPVVMVRGLRFDPDPSTAGDGGGEAGAAASTAAAPPVPTAGADTGAKAAAGGGDDPDLAIFRQLMSGGGDDPVPTPAAGAPRAAEAGKDTPTDGQPEAGATDGDGAEGKGAGEEPPPGGPDPEEMGKAYKALARDGTMSEKQIRSWMKEDPEGFIKSGLRAAKRQGDIDRFMEEHKALKETVGQGPQRGADGRFQPREPEAGAGEGAGAAAGLDLDALVKPLADELGAEVAPAAKAAFKGIIDSYETKVRDLDARHQAELQGLRQNIEFLAEVTARREMESARSTLSADKDNGWPEIASDGEFAKVQAEMQELAKSERFAAEGLQGLMRRACQIVYADHVARHQARLASATRAKANGQPTPPRQPTPARAKSPDETDREIFDRLHKGEEADTVRRVLQLSTGL
jgi:hypothetical protein